MYYAVHGDILEARLIIISTHILVVYIYDGDNWVANPKWCAER